MLTPFVLPCPIDRFWHVSEEGGYHAVEIFRNAAAVNEYGDQIVKSGCFPGFPSCTLVTLACRTNEIVAETYGNVEEIQKVTHDWGRCDKALKSGTLKPLPGDGSLKALAEKWGAFHYGWGDDLNGNPVASLTEAEQV